jgi:hypothetical protein
VQDSVQSVGIRQEGAADLHDDGHAPGVAPRLNNM